MRQMVEPSIQQKPSWTMIRKVVLMLPHWWFMILCCSPALSKMQFVTASPYGQRSFEIPSYAFYTISKMRGGSDLDSASKPLQASIRQEEGDSNTKETKSKKKVKSNRRKKQMLTAEKSDKLSKKQRTKRSNSNSSIASGSKDGACLRRIKHEWKDAVKLGIAYDWLNSETVTTQGRSPSGFLNKDQFHQYNYIRIGPYGKNLLRWHFSVRGPSNSAFADGIYHGRILLPKDYPMSPPRVQVLTASGRFNVGRDICLSASNYHPETWTPRWTILSLVDALRIHMLTSPNEINGIDSSVEERKQLAEKSRNWKAGPVDHRQMVKAGLFCNAKEEEEDKAEDESMDHEPKIKSKDEEQLKELLNIINSSEYSIKREATESTGNDHQMRNMRKRTILETAIILFCKVMVAILQSPLRLGILMFAIYHFCIRPNSDS